MPLGQAKPSQRHPHITSDIFTRNGLANSLLFSFQTYTVVSQINALMQQSISAK